jgi:PKD repeat protein
MQYPFPSSSILINPVWNTTFDGGNLDFGHAIWGKGQDIYTCGTSNSSASNSWDLLLVKWTNNGTQVWNRTWGGSDNEEGYAVCGDENGTFIYTCGYTSSFGDTTGDLLLIKWNANGTQIWNNTWGGSQPDCGFAVCVNGSEIYTSGQSRSFGEITGECILHKWASNGTLLWNQTWGDTMEDYTYSIVCDGPFIFTGGILNNSAMVARWDAAGNQAWCRTTGTCGIFTSSVRAMWLNDSILYTCGSNYTNIVGALRTMLFVKWDTLTGNPIWIRNWYEDFSYGGSNVWGSGSYIYTSGNADNSTFSSTGKQQATFVEWNADGSSRIHFLGTGSGTENSLAGWNDGLYIYTCGNTGTYENNSYDLFLKKWDMDVLRDRDPFADFFVNQTTVAKGSVVNFTFTGTPGNGLASYAWNFGDGTSNSTLCNTTHRYLVAGRYSVTLTVIDEDNDVSIAYKGNLITVTSYPIVPMTDVGPIVTSVLLIIAIGIVGILSYNKRDWIIATARKQAKKLGGKYDITNLNSKQLARVVVVNDGATLDSEHKVTASMSCDNHGGFFFGVGHICRKCGAQYCAKCYSVMIEHKEPCIKCRHPLEGAMVLNPGEIDHHGSEEWVLFSEEILQKISGLEIDDSDRDVLMRLLVDVKPDDRTAYLDGIFAANVEPDED